MSSYKVHTTALPATDTKPRRIRVESAKFGTTTVDWDHTASDAHVAAVLALTKRAGISPDDVWVSQTAWDAKGYTYRVTVEDGGN